MLVKAKHIQVVPGSREKPERPSTVVVASVQRGEPLRDGEIGAFLVGVFACRPLTSDGSAYDKEEKQWRHCLFKNQWQAALRGEDTFTDEQRELIFAGRDLAQQYAPGHWGARAMRQPHVQRMLDKWSRDAEEASPALEAEKPGAPGYQPTPKDWEDACTAIKQRTGQTAGIAFDLACEEIATRFTKQGVSLAAGWQEQLLSDSGAGGHKVVWKFDETTAEGREEMDLGRLYDYVKHARFLFPREVLTRYVLALMSKPFVILTGISGTGKTKIAQVLVDYVYQDLQPEDRIKRMAFVSVHPDWTDNRGLLGFYNPLENTYHSTPVLDLLIRARDDDNHPYFIILDEMNLARVEYYFSDFLSKMESRTFEYPKGADLELHELPHNATRHGAEERQGQVPSTDDGVPGRLHIPSNVFVTGTVNVDESTYMFSPKVLDRANVIEFNEVFVDGEGIESFGASFVLENADCRDLFSNSHWAFASNADFEEAKGDVREPLQGLIDILKPYHLHFGYRTINEISRFVSLARRTVHPFTADEALDIQILQKILPKFHGTRARMERPLSRVLLFCYGDRDVSEKDAVAKAASLREKAEGFEPDAQYPRCAQKCGRMLRTLKEQGYTSFIE